MTSNRRRKQDTRVKAAAAGIPYVLASRSPDAPPMAASRPPAPSTTSTGQITIRPPLAAWRRPIACPSWEQLTREHGPLIALVISSGDRWWELDDLAREAAGALQEAPVADGGPWIMLAGSRYSATKRAYLPTIVAKLDQAGALSRLTVRDVPDGRSCNHTTCRRRRGEPAPRRSRITSASPAGWSARPAVALSSARTLAEVMEEHPSLNEFGFGAFDPQRKRREQRQQEIAAGRQQLRGQEDLAIAVRDWLAANIAPIKTCTAGSYGMKHLVERAIGQYVPNGVLIAAALMAGYPWKGPHGPNVVLGMSKRHIDQALADLNVKEQ
jgi:hypothetical protein